MGTCVASLCAFHDRGRLSMLFDEYVRLSDSLASRGPPILMQESWDYRHTSPFLPYTFFVCLVAYLYSGNLQPFTCQASTPSFSYIPSFFPLLFILIHKSNICQPHSGAQLPETPALRDLTCSSGPGALTQICTYLYTFNNNN